MALQSKLVDNQIMAKSEKKTRSGKIKTRVTYLEMEKPLSLTPPVPTKPPIALIKANNIPPSFYEFLYEHVGKPHHWEERRSLSKEALNDCINNHHTEICVLYTDGCPAGFFELDLSHSPETIEIKYLGLMPGYQGLGLGKWFAAAAINTAWSHKPGKITIETNTLDHPAALPLYQKLGFSPVGIGESEIKQWK